MSYESVEIRVRITTKTGRTFEMKRETDMGIARLYDRGLVKYLQEMATFTIEQALRDCESTSGGEFVLGSSPATTATEIEYKRQHQERSILDSMTRALYNLGPTPYPPPDFDPGPTDAHVEELKQGLRLKNFKPSDVPDTLRGWVEGE